VRRVEFIIPDRPLSLQAANRPNFQAYKDWVAALASMAWTAPPVTSGDVHVSIVFLCKPRGSIDVDNIIKPIQDAMNGVVYKDDSMVTDTDSHRRYLGEWIELTHLPPVLIEMLVAGDEGVYVRVRNARALSEHI
jgi:crossover junction endodeoxyribonuclease RusA